MDAVVVSIVVPAYNEARRLPQSLRDMIAFFGRFPLPYEIIVVVEKSSDNTLQLAQEIARGHPQFRVIDNQVQKGKGYAVRSGMTQALGEFVFFMDADLSTPLTEVVSFLSAFESHPNSDVLIGSRQHPKSQIIRRQNPLREKMGQTFNHFVASFAFRGIKDTQCGFKAFRKNACAEIFSRATLNGFSFDVEILMLAQSMGFRIEEIPVRWVNSPESKVRVVQDSVRMLVDLMKVKRRVRRSLSEKPHHPSKSAR